jgi:hypothetical protein
LLLLTAVVAVGAAFFAWRERQLEPQRRAVARIVKLGGSVEIEQRGWLDAIWRGRDTQEVVSVTLPGHLADEAQLESLPALRHLTMSYKQAAGGIAMSITGGYTVWYDFVIDGQNVDPPTERPRLDRLKERLPEVKIDVSHDGVIVATDTAFDGYQTVDSFR